MWKIGEDRITWAPSDEGHGGGDGAGGDVTAGGGHSGVGEMRIDPDTGAEVRGTSIFDSEGDDEDEGGEDPDIDELLRALGDDDEDDEDEHDSLDVSGNQAAATALTDTIRRDIASARLADEVFGEEFDPTDADSVKTVMNRAYQVAIRDALVLAMRPMKMALEHSQQQTALQIQQSIASAAKVSGNVNQLNTLAPVMTTESGKKMLGPIQKQLAKDGKTVKEQADILNAFAKRMGLKATASRRSGTGGKQGTDSVRTGARALDALFSS